MTGCIDRKQRRTTQRYVTVSYVTLRYVRVENRHNATRSVIGVEMARWSASTNFGPVETYVCVSCFYFVSVSLSHSAV